MLLKKTVHDKLVAKVNNTGTSGFVLKTKYDTDKSALERKIPDTSTLVKKTDYYAKISEIEGKIPSISGLATNLALIAVENKIPDASSLVKKIDFNTKVSEIETKLADHNNGKYIPTSEFNKLTAQIFAARLAEVNLITKTDFDDKLKSLNQKVNSNNTKHLLVEDELKQLKTFDSSYFIGKSHFEEDGTQNYLVFQSLQRYFKQISGVGNDNYIYFWTSEGLSDENIRAPTTTDHKLNPQLNYFGTKTRVKFSASCSKQDKITYDHGKVVNIYIVYEISRNNNISNYPTLENCIFGAVSLAKNADIDKYKYSGYGIGFDRHGFFSHPSGGTGRNAIILRVDMSSSSKIDNRKKDNLIFGKDPPQGLEDILNAEKMYSINFSDHNKKFCLSLHYNGVNSYLFVNGTKIHKFKANDSDIVATPLCLENISKDWSIDNMKKYWIKRICL